MNLRRLIPTTLLAALLALPRLAQAADRPIDFNRDIRPLLSDRCFACHGPDDHERKARLRLDHRDHALAPAKSGAAAIVPGRPQESELVNRLLTSDADDHMPPASTGKKLSPEQITLLQRWIAEGAEYRAHWSFVPPQRPPLPAPAAHPIDGLVEARLAAEGLTPAPQADRTSLIRRATLDVTGLPPTPEEVDAFLADTAPKAYEKLVDRLLDSPRYGERMAVEWLDAARYADTHGYHLDSGRDMTAWRDWVIRAFNENKPFDAFTVEQLAGDLLPEATREQKIASGFNRNHMINYEGGAIPEEYQYAYLVDRVNTTSTVWLGLTMACSQCHDHKYDPLSKAEYYQFLGFFNSIDERGLDGNKGNASPLLKLSSPDQEKRLAELTDRLRAAEEKLKGPLPEIDAAQTAWETSLRSPSAVAWSPLNPTEAVAASGATLTRGEDATFTARGANPATEAYTLRFDAPLPHPRALRLEVLADESLPAHGPGRAGNGNFVLSSIRLLAGERVLDFASASADFSQNGYPISATLDAKPDTGWAVDGGQGQSHVAIFQLKEPAPTGPLQLELRFDSGLEGHAFGRFRLSVTDAPEAHGAGALPENLRAIVARDSAQRSVEDAATLRKHFREKISGDYRAQADALAALRKERDEFDRSIPSTMVMAELEKPRDTFIRLRGQYDKLGDKVAPGVPAALPPLPPNTTPNRLALARWLVDPKHPLTARVTVNRYWQMYFGTGLVKTAEDFGSQGEWPSHPELLDWLAREFVESGWNVKHLQRLILTSATYQRTSRVPKAAYLADPENRLLARGARLRLQAEFIRDQALAISGLLNGEIGGRSVSPYQPTGLWEELSMREDSKNFSAQFFVQSQGADLYRRSMYTFWKRSSPPPQMSTFDAPDRETCTVRRPRTNTPLQALVTLNDPTYIEASRKLGERLMKRPGSDRDRVRWAFRLATARPPSAAEEEVLLRTLEQQRAHYRGQPAAAEQLLAHGEAARDGALDVPELAAWTVLSSTVLNLDEALTKG